MAWRRDELEWRAVAARSLGCALGLAMLVAPPEGRASPEVVEPLDNTGFGYLDAPSLAPGHILRASPLFLIPQPGLEGDWQIEAGVHWANVWNYDRDRYLIDGEWIRADAKVFYAVTDTLFAGGLFPVIGRTGGWADSAITGAHGDLNMGNGGRGRFPRNRTVVEIREHGEVRTLARGDDWGIGDVAGFAVWQLSPGGSIRPALTLQLMGSLPTGDETKLQGLGEPSASLGGVASKRLWSSHALVFGGLGFSYGRSDDFMGLALHRDEYSGLVGLAYEYSSSLALFAQNLSTSALAEDYGAFSKSSHELSLGFKWQIAEDSILEFAVEENLFEYRNSPDIGAHLAWNSAWR